MTCLRKIGAFAANAARTLTLAAGLMAVASYPTFAQDDDDPEAGQKALENAEVIHAQVRVVAIDVATNSVTIRGPRGNLADVDVNPAVAHVDRLHVGDRLNVAYQQALLIHIDKLATKGVRERIETTVAIPASAGYTSSAHRVQVVATVTKIDRKRRLVTLRGPKHRQLLRAAHTISLDDLNVGDSVRAEFISAAAVELVQEPHSTR
ncbi:hypothetical protein [Paraburkholderia sp. BCC1884]|uniref:hypothetical protein n=1 Tax=Paraburkholderia sp. BCC1884 TaxID=2562668 RepID=UPI001183A7F4|nr:hypothetical protein [Paraburkholderia sp. BCC1884]